MSFKKPLPTLLRLCLALLGLAVFAFILYQIPPIRQQLDWRVDLALTYLRGVVHPAGPVPTPVNPIASQALLPTPSPTASSTPLPSQAAPTLALTPTPLPTSTPPPPAAFLLAPAWELQGPNNCGPASLAIFLRYYGWEGDQDDIAEVVKPLEEDRNVNPEELVYFVRNYAGWLSAEFRVGGNLSLLRQLIAAGFPVMVEESFFFESPYWPNDDLWAAHYLLLTGYDDDAQVFIGQDSFHGPDQRVPYATLDEGWQIFNRVYILVYPPSQQGTLQAILGENWDPDANRQRALEVALAETQADPTNAFAWFNLGSNLVYFERYTEAANAYDTSRSLGLPQRMLRYQFGPFFAYFHSVRTSELLALTEYALERTPNSEEALLWHGWALYRQGDVSGAIADWREALQANPSYQDARYALEFVGASP